MNTCQHCGEAFAPNPNNLGVPAMYCGDVCRGRAYSARKKLLKEQGSQVRCLCCGDLYQPIDDSRLCSAVCVKYYEAHGMPINGKSTLNKIYKACGYAPVLHGNEPITVLSIKYKEN